MCGCINNPAGQGHRANGDPCGRPTVPGGTKCHLHGGSTPIAKYKAEQAMALLRMPAIEALHEVLELQLSITRQYAENTCPTCGYPKGETEELQAIAKVISVIIRQAQTILDRTGLPPRAVLEVKQSDGDFDLKALTDGERSRMMALLGELRAVKEEARQRMHGVETAPTQESIH